MAGEDFVQQESMSLKYSIHLPLFCFRPSFPRMLATRYSLIRSKCPGQIGCMPVVHRADKATAK